MILSKQLNDLGIKAASSYYWVINIRNEYHLSASTMEIHGSAPDIEAHEYREWFPAYDVVELGEILPEYLSILKIKRYNEPMIYIVGIDDISIRNECRSENIKLADAMAEVLIQLKENKLI